MENWEAQRFRDDIAYNLKSRSRERRKKLLETARRLPGYWKARKVKILERGGVDTLEKSPGVIGFEKVEGYKLEVFSSQEEMYQRMEQIRKSSANEAHGFIIQKSGQLGFYYQLGDSEISVEMPHGLDTSWHSHPDSNISEAIFDESDVPEGMPQEIKDLARRVVESYAEIDEASPKKVSLMDLINFMGHGRSRDLISMPGNLLDTEVMGGDSSSLSSQFAKYMDREWKSLVAETQPKLTEENFELLRSKMILRYYFSAITEFKSMISKLGFEKMTVDNFATVLEKMGLPHKFHKV